MLAEIQRTVYPEEVTCQLHVMAQARESSPVIDRRSNHCDTGRSPEVKPLVRGESATRRVHVLTVALATHTAKAVRTT